MATSDDTIQQALNMYLSRNFKNKTIADRVGKSEQTLYNWMKAGKLTNGTHWKDYREEIERQQIQQAKQVDMERRAEEQTEFLETVQGDIETMYKEVRHQIESGKVEVQVKDVETLVKLYAMLDSQAAEKAKWMEKFALDTFEIVFEIVDERQFALFKTRMLQLKNRRMAEMGDVANAKLAKDTKQLQDVTIQ